jgi:small subunit ribosomal protein S3
MGQKVHPLGFRLGISKNHFSYWFSKSNKYFSFVQEDVFIRNFIYNHFPNVGISDIEIKRKFDILIINIFTAQPTLIIGSNGSLLQDLQKSLSNFLFLKFNFYNLNVNVIEIINPESNANVLAEFIRQQLEKRVPFRKTIKSAISKAQKSGLKGIKIQISGRLNGAEIARTEWVREGQVPLHTIRANIDYCNYKALVIFRKLCKS